MPDIITEAKPSVRGDWKSSRGITTDRVDDYLYSVLPPRDAVVAEMEAEASAHDVPSWGQRSLGSFIYWPR